MAKRRSLLIIFILLAMIFMTACENLTQLRCATISEITSAGSDNYAVRITPLNDTRIKDKYVDVQIKFDKASEVVFWEENQDRLTLKIDDYDEWYSLTSLIATAEDRQGYEEFEKFSQSSAKTYLFNYDGNLEITFRVVVGDVEENSAGTGQILVGSEPISDQFTLKIK